MKILLSILFLISLTNLCSAKIDQDLVDYADFLRNQIIIEYKNVDHNLQKIERHNLPYVECANDCNQKTKEVSYYLHGFMGSPYEMKFIADRALDKGHVVFNDLIFGYGYDAKMANHFKKELWYAHVEKNLLFIFNHADKVNLVGFSTGGLLISHFLEKHPELHNKVNKVQLVSPFYFSHIAIAPAFSKILRIFMPTVPVDTFYKLTGFPDVEVITLEPKFYLQDVPVYAAGEVAELAAQFVDIAHITNTLSNIEIYLTKNDQVLSFDKSLPFLQKIYPKAKIFQLENGKYPHHLMAPLVSNEAATIKNNF